MALRFKLDENIPGEAAALLQGAGHDVRTALEQKLGGSPYDRLGFGDIRAYPAVQGIGSLLDLLRHALTATSREPVSRRLWIVEPGQLRIRD